MLSNREIARLFTLYGELLLLHEQDEGLAAKISSTAYRLRNYEQEVMSLSKKELAQSFRPEAVRLIAELNEHGTVDALDELIQLTPSGVFEMMRIKGLGGKKLAVLWRSAKIDSLEALLNAGKEQKIRSIPGFGVKSEQNIIEAIESYNSSQDRFHYASVARGAAGLVAALQKLLGTKLISLCGEIRRQSTTVAAVEIIAAVPAKRLQAADVRKLLVIDSSTAEQTAAHTLDEIPVIIYHTSVSAFTLELFKRTGNDEHVAHVLERVAGLEKANSETAIYKKAKLPFIEPELRENITEWDLKPGTNLITVDDIKGVVHNHTDWSDGVDSLEAFSKACKKRGFEYVVISDHSKNAHYAGGLKEEKVLRQFAEIDKLNKLLKPFRIFKSIECDILVSGELDYDSSLLKQFDLVIVSIHQLLKMDEQKATKRLIAAIENPFTTILGHMTGRQLLIRPGYPVDVKKVTDACAANGVVIEINANPYRLDMDWSHIPYALEKGVMISINPDAHSIGEIENIQWGVSAARKGGLSKDRTWNAMNRKAITEYLAARKARS